jgi:hypothetical protein
MLLPYQHCVVNPMAKKIEVVPGRDAGNVHGLELMEHM